MPNWDIRTLKDTNSALTSGAMLVVNSGGTMSSLSTGRIGQALVVKSSTGTPGWSSVGGQAIAETYLLTVSGVTLTDQTLVRCSANAAIGDYSVVLPKASAYYGRKSIANVGSATVTVSAAAGELLHGDSAIALVSGEALTLASYVSGWETV